MLNNLRLSNKLPLLFGTTSVTLIALILAFEIFMARSHALEEAEQRLSFAASAQQTSFNHWYDAVTSDLLAMAINPTTQTGISRFEDAYDSLGEFAYDSLREWYIDDNPHPFGSRHLLDRAEAGSRYNVQHADYHPYFRSILERHGYYDVFLFDMDGNLIYSVAKELDYATNFVDGPYAGSGLGQAFRAARDGVIGEISYFDFSPYEPSDGVKAAFVSTPVADESGTIIGVIAYQLMDGSLEGVVGESEAANHVANSYLLDSEGELRASTGADMDQISFAELPQVAAIQRGEAAYFSNVEGLSGVPVASQVRPLSIGGETWGLVLEEPIATIMAPINRDSWIAVGLGGLGALLAVGFGYLTSRSVALPVNRAVQSLKLMAGGDNTCVISDLDRGDELGDIARSVDNLRERLLLANAAEKEKEEQMKLQQEVVSALAAGLNRMAEGDFSTDITTNFGENYEELRRNYNRTVESLSGTVDSLIGKSQRIRSGTDRISSATDDLAQRTETMAATLEETAAAVDQLTASVRTSADGAKSVEGIVSEARSETDRSNTVVENAVRAMTEIEKSSEHISQIIGVIDDIAFQTNLLALNAGVEAARAGTAGRGFAVVASEVRGLAQRSSEAAKEIKTLITSSAEQVTAGVDLVGKTGEAIGRINQQVSHISTLISEISTGAAEQATALTEINVGMSQLGEVTQKNAQMVVDVSEDGKSLTQDAADLSQVMSQFRTEQRKASPAQEIDSATIWGMPEGSETEPVVTFQSIQRRSASHLAPVATGDDGGDGLDTHRETTETVDTATWDDMETDAAPEAKVAAKEAPAPQFKRAVGAEGVWEDF